MEDKHPRYDKFASRHRACYYRLQTGSCFSEMSNALGFKLFPRCGIPLEHFIYLKFSHHPIMTHVSCIFITAHLFARLGALLHQIRYLNVGYFTLTEFGMILTPGRKAVSDSIPFPLMSPSPMWYKTETEQQELSLNNRHIQSSHSDKLSQTLMFSRRYIS